MLRRSNYTTLLLSLIVILLFVALGIALYYVLELDWFSKENIQIYNESNSNQDKEQIRVEIKKQIQYDFTKRQYNLVLNTNELKLVINKDGTVDITMLKNEKYAQISGYKELLDNEIKLSLTNIIRGYNVEVANDGEINDYILLLDSNGYIYIMSEQELLTNSKYVFTKVDGLAKIIDVKQIIIEENTEGINAIAIDESSNELLLSEYILNNK